MRYTILVISIISTLYLPGFTSAQIKVELEPNWIDKLYQKINQKVITPVKQSTQDLPEGMERSIKNLLEKARQEKQEEIKQEIKSEVKEEAKEWGQRAAERIKKFLAPLKNKIQQGTGLIREAVNKVKDFLIGFFKE